MLQNQVVREKKEDNKRSEEFQQDKNEVYNQYMILTLKN